MCKTSCGKKNQQFCCVSVRDFEPKILIQSVHITNLKKTLFDRKLIFSYEEIQKKYMSPYYFLFYTEYEFMIVESPKYKTICLNSPKSSEFAKKN